MPKKITVDNLDINLIDFDKIFSQIYICDPCGFYKIYIHLDENEYIVDHNNIYTDNQIFKIQTAKTIDIETEEQVELKYIINTSNGKESPYFYGTCGTHLDDALENYVKILNYLWSRII